MRLRPLLAIVRDGLEDVGVPGLPVKVVGGLGVVEARAILLPWRWLGRLGLELRRCWAGLSGLLRACGSGAFGAEAPTGGPECGRRDHLEDAGLAVLTLTAKGPQSSTNGGPIWPLVEPAAVVPSSGLPPYMLVEGAFEGVLQEQVGVALGDIEDLTVGVHPEVGAARLPPELHEGGDDGADRASDT
jgi:hypothetical protein